MDESLAAATVESHRAGKSPVGPMTALSLLSWAHFICDGASNFIPGVLPAILVTLNIPLKLVGTIMAALLAGQALQPVWGWIADEIGGYWFIILGAGGAATAGALVGIAPGYWSLMGALLLVGTCAAMFHPQALADIRLLPSRRTGLFMSTFLIAGELGRGLWPLLASLVVVGLGMRWLLLLAAPALLTLPFITKWIPAQPKRHADMPRTSLRRHLPDLSVLVGYSGMRATVQYSLGTFLPLLWVHRGGSLVGGASLVSVLLIAGMVGNVAGGHLADNFGRRPVILFATVASAILLALMLLSHGIILWILLALLGMGIYATMPVQILLGQDILPENRSLGSGLALGFSNAIGAFVMIFLGILAARWSIMAVLWINVAVCTAAIAVAAMLPEGSREEIHRFA